MEVVKPNSTPIDKGYHPVIDQDGTMHCSCGSRLIKVDEDTYMCSTARVRYRISSQEIRVDKFGNVLITLNPHDPANNQRGALNGENRK